MSRGCACHMLSTRCPQTVQDQRSDDTEEKARNRLRTYHANVDAVVDYYREQLVEVRVHRNLHRPHAYLVHPRCQSSNRKLHADRRHEIHGFGVQRHQRCH